MWFLNQIKKQRFTQAVLEFAWNEVPKDWDLAGPSLHKVYDLTAFRRVAIFELVKYLMGEEKTAVLLATQQSLDSKMEELGTCNDKNEVVKLGNALYEIVNNYVPTRKRKRRSGANDAP